MRIIDEKEFKNIKDQMRIIPGSKGERGQIYRLGTEAIKIFHQPLEQIEEEIKRFQILANLPLQRFILTKDIICKDNQIIGVTMDYIEDAKETFDDIELDTLSRELRIIKKDLSILEENRIALMDCHEGNLMYNGKWYITDTQEYTPLAIYPEFCRKLIRSDRSYTLANYNLYQINGAITYFLSNRLSSNFKAEDKVEFVVSMYDEIEKQGGQFYTYIGDVIESDKKSCKTLKQYVYKKINF